MAVIAVAALAVVLSVTAVSASASTWHNTGATAFTATSGPGTLTLGANTMAWSGCTMPLTAGLSDAGPTWVSAMTGSLRCAGVRIAGVPWHFYCPSVDVDGVQMGVPPISVIVQIRIRCFAGPGATNGTNDLCRIDGTLDATYVNPTMTDPGSFATRDSRVTVANNPPGACPASLGLGAATLARTMLRNLLAGAIIRQP
ncbi:hypothetical protein [Baekduia alba]|uniref:hypothetical protein n=1 Tax=Baekduia alba TaxID=2997333 RepID=UPI002341B7EC|nr:hypothetical protein [Baekduia alba]